MLVSRAQQVTGQLDSKSQNLAEFSVHAHKISYNQGQKIIIHFLIELLGLEWSNSIRVPSRTGMIKFLSLFDFYFWILVLGWQHFQTIYRFIGGTCKDDGQSIAGNFFTGCLFWWLDTRKKKGIYNSHERMLTVTVIDRGKPCAPC